MKVIDLLNKIANGEKVPKKIKVGGYYYECYERLDNHYNYKQIDIDTGKYFDDYLCDTYFLDNKVVLNWEVEIIEEDKKIEEINEIEYYHQYDECWVKDKFYKDQKGNLVDEIIIDKVNEIIDILNEMREDK